jgi:catechol 2,3-dioxygenase-like lactoylglutathione lyase family enzyme
MIRVRRITHATFETPVHDAQVQHYAQVLGLTLVERDGDTAYLSTVVDHHTVVLRKGAEPRCVRLGFQLGADGDLDAFARQTEAKGIKTRRETDSQPGIREIVSFEDPKGTIIEVFREHESASHGYKRSGIVPNKLGHVAFSVVDIQAAVQFYCDVLGFRESDWMADFFAFLRCGPDHHSINLVSGKRSKMHHIAFELRDWTHIRDACDFLCAEKVPLAWGPVRHGIGHNISIYYRTPDGQMIELFTELDRINEEDLGWWEPRITHQEYPQKGKVWSDVPLAANMWGLPPPDGFLD